MRLGFFAACSLAFAAVVGACGANEAAGAAEGSGGAGGAGGAGGGGAFTTSISASASIGSASSGGQDAGATCDMIPDCGNFGSGCVNCAITGACADAYQLCFDDPECVDYATCIDQCPAGDTACPTGCAANAPDTAVAEYEALVGCVLCDQCAGPCATPPTECSPSP